MKVFRILALILSILVLSGISYAIEDFRDVSIIDSNGNLIEDVIAHVTFEGDNTRVVLVRESGLSLKSSGGMIEIVLDDDNTDGIDYYFYGMLEEELVFTPVGQVRGNVYDSLNNLEAKANVEFNCDKPSNIVYPVLSDKYGGFSSYLPVGNCVVSATDGKMLDKKEILIKQGETYNLDLNLESKVNSNNSIMWIVVLVAISLLVLFYKRPKRKLVKKKKESGKLKNIMKTLNQKELNIVSFLVDNGNTSTGSKIRYALKIPKTSFTRILDRLENKKIIDVETNGNLKKIKISEWLLKK